MALSMGDYPEGVNVNLTAWEEALREALDQPFAFDYDPLFLRDLPRRPTGPREGLCRFMHEREESWP